MIEKIKTKEEAKKLIDVATELFLHSIIDEYTLRTIISTIKNQLTGKEES